MTSCSSSYRCVTPAFIVTRPSLLFVWLPLFVRALAILIMGLLYSTMTSSLLITIAISHFQTRHMIKFQEGPAFRGHQSSYVPKQLNLFSLPPSASACPQAHIFTSNYLIRCSLVSSVLGTAGSLGLAEYFLIKSTTSCGN